MMDELDRLLRHTLADFRVSRGEKRVLNQVLDEMDADQRQLARARRLAFEIARGEIVSPDAAAVLHWLEEILKLLQFDAVENQITSEAHFSPGNNCGRKIAGLFRTARRHVDVCVFTITDDRIADAILDAHQRGVAIRIISDNDKSTDMGSDIARLSRKGIPVRIDRSEYHMHHKYAIFDQRRLLTGSYNWTRSAARYNEENFIVTDNKNLLRAFSREFQNLWERLE